MINFNVPPYIGTEMEYVKQAAENRKICGDGPFTKRCHEWLERSLGGTSKVLLTTSGTSALEMAAILCDLHPGDEVILPSYTFSTTATAFVLVGAKLVFVDIRPDTMNIDESKIEAAITDKTKVIVAVHYAGVACEMDSIMEIAQRHGLLVVEDAAQAVMSSYKGRPLGAIGTFGCYSFHETKNYSMGEGGAIIINDPTYSDRLHTWNRYHEAFLPLQEQGLVQLPCIPEGCIHNAHMYYLKFDSLEQRTRFISYLKERGIQACFHYIPLHSSPAGMRFGSFFGEDENTTKISEQLVRLPLYYDLAESDCNAVIRAVLDYFEQPGF